MLKKVYLFFLFFISFHIAQSQFFLHPSKLANHWVDSVFTTLSPIDKITQLLIIRMPSDWGTHQIDSISTLLNKYKIGGLIFFKDPPTQVLCLIRQFQSISRCPLFISLDAEWGVAMRIDSVIPLPHQMMLGAMNDYQHNDIVFQYGKLIGEQCKRLGIQIDFGPIEDINNNPLNPIISIRSYGENKKMVSYNANQYVKGLYAAGVMGCLKHFPGHGSVSIDSHLALPVVEKSLSELDTEELYPFRQSIREGATAIMVGHLLVPNVDTAFPASLSKVIITRYLKDSMDFKGLVISDALDMKAITDHYTGKEAIRQSLIAGNDILLLPSNVDTAIAVIQDAIQKKQVDWNTINDKVRKILLLKYNLGLSHWSAPPSYHLVEDLNRGIDILIQRIATHAITLFRLTNRQLFPLHRGSSMVYVELATHPNDSFLHILKKNYTVMHYQSALNDSIQLHSILSFVATHPQIPIVLNIRDIGWRPAHHFGLSSYDFSFFKLISEYPNVLMILSASPYLLPSFIHGKNILVAYEDNPTIQYVTMQMLLGIKKPVGTLPIRLYEEAMPGNN